MLFARRLVAQRCLYGVDKNPFAVHLAKLSLWLATLAKDHPFTFVDHALRCGDSLVGLSREQIACFDWAPAKDRLQLRGQIDKELDRAQTLRVEIQSLAASDDTETKQRLLHDADDSIETLRRVANLVVEAFFSADKDKARRTALAQSAALVASSFPRLPEVEGSASRRAFHWELEFPEVFSRENPGFDAFVGNPPFAGKNTLLASSGDGSQDRP